MLKTVYENWQSVTAGQSSRVGLPLYVDLWTALGAACGTIVVAQLYPDLSFGLRLRAAREDEHAAQAAGVQIRSRRLIAFVLSTFIVAIGGVLYGHFLGTLAVNMFWLDLTFLTLAMLVVGGLRSLTGKVVGTLSVRVFANSYAAWSYDDRRRRWPYRRLHGRDVLARRIACEGLGPEAG